jgi:glycogen debranching enzyme
VLAKPVADPQLLGATLTADGTHFAVYSEHAVLVEVCLFGAAGREVSRHKLARTGDNVHRGFVKGTGAGAGYGFRIDGPWQPEAGHRFDPSKLLLDPYATEIDRPFTYDPRLAERGFDTAALMPKGRVTAKHLKVENRQAHEPQFIYELNVRAFTMRHPDVPPHMRGTIAALAESCIIEHLRALGVDTIELMPITAWIDERHLPPLGLRNAWGYNPVSFLAVDPRLAPGGVGDVRDTITKLHAAGFNVVLDIVFNHSGESDAFGPTLSFRGIDNASYYRLLDGRYINDAGTGNTLALDRPHTVQLAIDAMCHWVEKCGFDGFRFDLASVMGRLQNSFDPHAPLLKAIDAHPVLASRILIAEPWDVGPGGYQLGQFAPRWHEWNDRFRDDVRRFWRGDDYSANALATRLAGSSDAFRLKAGPSRSVNFIAAHDGFTLKDIVAYPDKLNFANGEDNRDGKSSEVTWLNGDVRVLLAVLFFSRGTPMLTAGDEFGRTQQGNNNAYAQDNDITWLDWENADHELIQLVRELARLRNAHPLLREDGFLSDSTATWFDLDGKPVRWDAPNLRFLGLMVRHKLSAVAIVVNGSSHAQFMRLKPRRGFTWTRRFCTKTLDDCPAISVSLFEEVPM